MSTPASLIQVAFGSGIEESQPDEIVDPSSAFLVLENGRQALNGGYDKRPGFAALSNTRLDGTSRTSGLRMFGAGPSATETCVIDSTPTLDVYSPTTGRWSSKGMVPEAFQMPTPVPSLAMGSAVLADSVSLNGVTVLAWSAVADSSFAYPYYAVVDATTGAVIRNPEIVGASGSTLRVRMASYGNYVIAVAFGMSATVAAYYLDTSSATTINTGWVSIGNIATDFSAGNYCRAVGLTANNAVILLYVNNSAGTDWITVKKVTIAGVTQTKTINTASAQPDPPDIAEGGTVLWVVWGESTVVKAQGLDPATITSTLATKATVITPTGTPVGSDWLRISPMATAGTAAVFASTTAKITYAQSIKVNAGAAATNGTLGSVAHSVVVGRPFLRGSRVYGHFSSSNANELVLCECTPDTTSATPLSMYLRPVAVPIQRGIFSSGSERVAVIDSGKYIYGYTIKRSGITNGSAATTYDFASPYRWRPATVNGVTALSGGVTSIFDGTRVFEAGFLVAPKCMGAAAGAGGALTFTLGGRNYVLTFADHDANGDLHISGVSTPVISGNMTAKISDVLVGTLSITARGTRNGSHLVYGSVSAAQRILIWGTTDGGNAPYYLVGEVTNDPGQTSITFHDNMTDATLISQPLLYGTGNLPGTSTSVGGTGSVAGQDHRAPPGLGFLVSYNGMLVGASGSILYYSSQPIDGEGQWFSPVFTMPLDDIVTALEVQDGTLYAFTRRSVLALAGDPPSDNASSGGLGTPRKLASDVGCVNANSTLVTAMGIHFLSERGLELLTRGGAVQYFGSPLRRTIESFPVVTAAVLDRLNGLMRFPLAASQPSGVVSGNGRDLIYDLTIGTWVSVDRKYGTSADQPAQDAAVVLLSGVYRYAWLAADGTVYYERDLTDSSAYLDGSQWVTKAAETGKFKSAGIQGTQAFNRLLLLERKSTDHNTSVSLSYNYETAYRTARTWTSTEINALLSAGWPITQLKHDAHVDGDPSQALGVRVADATPTSGTVGNGRGAVWLALTLDVTPKAGAFEVPEAAA